MGAFENYWNNSISAGVMADYESGNVKIVHAGSTTSASKQSKEYYNNNYNFDEFCERELEEIEGRVAVRIRAEKLNKKGFDF